MVASHSTRKPGAARKATLKGARRPSTLTPLPKAISTELGTLVRELELIRSTTVVAAALLDAQAADLDTDIAHLLRRNASDRLHAMIEKAAMILAVVRTEEAGRQVH